MKGRLFQLIDSDGSEQIGLIHCNSEIDEDTIGYHWGTFCATNDADADEFAEYISEKLNEVFVRVFVEEIYN